MSLLPLLAAATVLSYGSARRARDTYQQQKNEGLAIADKLAKVMPESGRFYTAMVMLSEAARTNKAALELVQKYHINFLTYEQAKSQSSP